MSGPPAQRYPSSPSPSSALKRPPPPNVLPASSKRPRPSNTIATMSHRLPPLPTLQGEVMLEIFMHRSLSSGSLNEDFGDSERLATIGKRVLSMAVAQILFDKRPMLDATGMEVEFEAKTAYETIDEWVTNYQLREKVRCPGHLRESLKHADETFFLFHTYVGAAYLQHGLSDIISWIGKLLDPEYEPSTSTVTSVPEGHRQMARSPPPPHAMHSPGAYSNPPPPSATPPPLPVSSAFASQSAILPIFNQLCSQRRVTLDWPAVSTGPPHAPSWTVDCMANGILKGRGAGKSKQLAKEDAAKQAYVALGWAAPGL
ncbi:hypothetical protein FA95DRAFT_1678383 [Auriscalpium vulgare]|uniref:Uncharacterized protein n=1 Tax=Auriscalpium vulgare TaxID=40419 RepID=A0ACB8RVT2_9AGAM|nr:hypothetical protein FA95DRAFT_1678383 [Auriscalpium vulgare]